MAMHTAVATTTLQNWPVKVPNQDAHLNLGAGVDTPNQSSFVRAGEAGRVLELGGFDFSLIPAGSIINGLTIRQRMKGSSGSANPGLTFSVKISGIIRESMSFNVDTFGIIGNKVVQYGGIVTREELPFLTIEESTFNAGVVDPPIPDG